MAGTSRTNLEGFYGELSGVIASQWGEDIMATVDNKAMWNADNVPSETRYYVLNVFDIAQSMDFAGSHHWVVDNSNGWADITGQEDCRISVKLPHGTTVTALRVLGQEVGSNCSVILSRIQEGDFVGETVMASVDLTSTMEELSDTSISVAVIDNDDYEYLMTLFITSAGTESRLKRIQVDYTVVRPYP